MQIAKGNYINWFLYAALVVLAVEVGVLIKQNKDLKSQLEQYKPPFETLKRGDKVEPFTYFKLSGDSAQVNYAASDKETMLWFFTTTCPACRMNVENWKAIYAQNEQTHHYNIIPVSIDSISALVKYSQEMNLSYAVNSLKHRKEIREQYKVRHVPQTIIVGKDGIVTDVVVGVMKPEDKDKLISAAF
jgi:peroxiredoxin